ncbi:MAG: hypothetical protein RL497_1592 [Pseudomonadota bacterium]|jgi:hypothetical protein
MHTRTLRLILLLAITLPLSGCTVKIAYYFLDWGLHYKLNHYLSLNNQQSQHAKKSIQAFHHWHQRHALPEYIVFLTDAKNRLSGPPLTPSEIHSYRQRIKYFGEQSLDNLLPHIATLTQSLNEKQIQQLFKTLNEDQKDYQALYLTPNIEDIREDLKNDALKSIKKYMGRLNNTQKTRITRWSQDLKPFGAAASQEQDQWEQLMAQLLSQPTAADYSAQLKKLLLHDITDWSQKNRAIMEFNQNLSYELMADTLNSRSPEQNASLIEKLNAYIEDCQDLIVEAKKEDEKNYFHSNP